MSLKQRAALPLQRCMAAVAIAVFAIVAGSRPSLSQTPNPDGSSSCEPALVESRAATRALSVLNAEGNEDPVLALARVRGAFVAALEADPCPAGSSGRNAARKIFSRARTASSLDADPNYASNELSLLRDATQGARIIGGRRTKLYNDAVALFSANAAQAQCTGVLVAPQAVLTAAHCVCDKVDARAKAGWDANRQGGAVTIESRFTRSLLDCPTYEREGDKALVGRDVAILFLTGPFPRELAAPRRIATPDMLWKPPAKTVRAVGFGFDDQFNLGIKEHVDIAIASLDCNGPDALGKWGCSSGNELVASSPRSQKDTCRGDSGGPIYVWDDLSSDYYLIGITSRGLPPSGDCGGGGIYGLVNGEVLSALASAKVPVVIGRP